MLDEFVTPRYADTPYVSDFINENMEQIAAGAYGITIDTPFEEVPAQNLITQVMLEIMADLAARRKIKAAENNTALEIKFISLALRNILLSTYAYEMTFGAMSWPDLLRDLSHIERTVNNLSITDVDPITVEEEAYTSTNTRTAPTTTTTLPVRQKSVASQYPQENLSDSGPLILDNNGLPETQYDYASSLADTWQSGTSVNVTGGASTTTVGPRVATTLAQHSEAQNKTVDPDTTDETSDNKRFVYELDRLRTIVKRWNPYDNIYANEYLYARSFV